MYNRKSFKDHYSIQQDNWYKYNKSVSDYTFAYSRNTNADDKLRPGHTKRACIPMHRDWDYIFI